MNLSRMKFMTYVIHALCVVKALLWIIEKISEMLLGCNTSLKWAF